MKNSTRSQLVTALPNRPWTSSSLASHIGVEPKTVRNRIYELKSQMPNGMKGWRVVTVSVKDRRYYSLVHMNDVAVFLNAYFKDVDATSRSMIFSASGMRRRTK